MGELQRERLWLERVNKLMIAWSGFLVLGVSISQVHSGGAVGDSDLLEMKLYGVWSVMVGEGWKYPLSCTSYRCYFFLEFLGLSLL